jgi:hypothetical protein
MGMRRTVVRNHEATRLHNRFAPSTFPEGTFCCALLPSAGLKSKRAMAAPNDFYAHSRLRGPQNCHEREENWNGKTDLAGKNIFLSSNVSAKRD